jgi:uncharacterized protein YcfJ
MFWLRKTAWSGFVWLTAAMTVVASMPRLACACASGASPTAASAPASCACCCGGACCGARAHSCSTVSSQSKAPTLQQASSDNPVRNVAATGRSVCKTVLVQIGPVIAAKAKQAHDLGTVAAALAPFLEGASFPSDPVNRAVFLRSQLLPVPDLITTLQHFTI